MHRVALYQGDKRWCLVCHGSGLVLTAQLHCFSLTFQLSQVGCFGKVHGMTPEQLRALAAQCSLLDGLLNTDLEAVDAELNALLALLKSHPFQALFAIQAEKDYRTWCEYG